MNKQVKLLKKKTFNVKLQENIFYYWHKYHRHFFRSLIWRGRKISAFNFFIKIKYELKLRENIDPLLVFFVALLKITPDVILFPFRRSGAVNMVPMPITIKKQITFATKWVIKLLKDNYKKINLITLIDLLIDSVYDKGLAIEKKTLVHETALKNKYLVRYFK